MTVSPIAQESIDNVNQSPGKAEEGVLDLIHTVMHLYRAKQYQVLRDGPHALTPQLARLTTGLRERGLLDGVADEADRRNFRLSLTPAGQAIQRVLAEQARKLNAEAVHGLTAAENQQLLALLMQVGRNLDSQP